jgi:hypothetical protein
VLYSLQNAFGEVYGTWQMPPNNRSADVWVSELRHELADILGINGVCESGVRAFETDGTPTEKLVIDIEPSYLHEQERLERVHMTIGRLATPEVQS